MSSKQNPILRADKQALLRKLETARKQISDDAGTVSDKLNVSQRFKDSVSSNTMKWVGGGVAAGVLLAVLSPIRFRKKKSKAEPVKRGLMATAFFGLLGIAGKQILYASLPQAQRLAQEWFVSRYSGAQFETPEPPELPIEE